MPTITSNIFSNSALVIDLGTTSNLSIAKDILVKANAEDATAVSGSGSNQTIWVQGKINADYAIDLGEYMGSSVNNAVKIASTGYVLGWMEGITMNGTSNAVDNRGTIRSEDAGIRILSPYVMPPATVDGGELSKTISDYHSTVTNSGLIKVDGGTGIKAYGIDKVTITNTGTINCDHYYAIDVSGSAGAIVINSGRLVGSINLSGFNDVYYGRLGTSTFWESWGTSSIYGNGGNDRIYGGKSGEDIDGGLGNDMLSAGAGNDEVSGGRGNDNITGGSGNDVLTGNSGSDVFRFGGNFGNDRITDFSHGADIIDLKSVLSITSFYDLTHNHIKISGKDLIITDGTRTITLEETSKSDLYASDFLF